MRRLIIEEPVSRAAIWGRKIAWFSLPVLLAGIFLMRQGAADYIPGLAVIFAAVLLALMALQFAIVSFIQIWRKGRAGLRFACIAFIVSLMVLVFPGLLITRFFVFPYYADLSTDLENPPVFSISTTAPADRSVLKPNVNSNNLSDKHLQNRQMQQKYHPNLGAKKTEMNIADAFNRAITTANKEGWHITNAVPPTNRALEGHLDAVKYSRILRIPIDIIVRLRPNVEGTTIDIRSIPRYQLFDVGTEPTYIEQYLRHFK